MKFLALFGSLALLVLSSTSGAATPEEQVLVPIHAFADAFNKGDMKAAAATQLPAGVSIIDDVPPHVWIGPTAFADWGKALESADQAQGKTDEHAVLGKPTKVVIGTDRAYVVTPVAYTFKQKGAPMTESAHLVFALQKQTGGWLIAGWTWAGSTPKPAVVAKSP